MATQKKKNSIAAADTGAAAPVVLPAIEPSFATAQVLAAEDKPNKPVQKPAAAAPQATNPQGEIAAPLPRRRSSLNRPTVRPTPPTQEKKKPTANPTSSSNVVQPVAKERYIPQRVPSSFFHEPRPPPPPVILPSILCGPKAPLAVLELVFSYVAATPLGIKEIAQLGTVCRRWYAGSFTVYKSVSFFPAMCGDFATNQTASLWSFLGSFFSNTARGQHTSELAVVGKGYHKKFFTATLPPPVPVWPVVGVIDQLLYLESLDLRGCSVIGSFCGSVHGSGCGEMLLQRLSKSKRLHTIKLDVSFLIHPNKEQAGFSFNSTHQSIATEKQAQQNDKPQAGGQADLPTNWVDCLLPIPTLRNICIGHQYTPYSHDTISPAKVIDTNIENLAQLFERLTSFVCHAPLTHKAVQTLFNSPAPNLEKLTLNLVAVRASLAAESDTSHRLPKLAKLRITNCLYTAVLLRILVQWPITTMKSINFHSGMKGNPVSMDRSYTGSLVVYLDTDSEPTTPRQGKAKKAVIMSAPKPAAVGRRASLAGRRMSQMNQQAADASAHNNILQPAIMSVPNWGELGQYSMQLAISNRPATKRTLGKKKASDKDDAQQAVNRPEFPFDYGMPVDLWDQVVAGLDSFRLIDVGIANISTTWNFQYLTTLSLSTNFIIDVSPLLTQLAETQTITDLDLSANEISSLSNDIGKLINLKKLHLQKNQLNKLPAACGYLVNLNELNLAANKFRSVPPATGFLTSLTTLTLDNNDFSILPDAVVTRCTQITTLSVQNTKLKAIPPSIKHLANLETLLLRGCQYLHNIPPALAELDSLSIIDLRDSGCDTATGKIQFDGAQDSLWEFCPARQQKVAAWKDSLAGNANAPASPTTNAATEEPQQTPADTNPEPTGTEPPEPSNEQAPAN
eukprot:TRINITY_DN66393_c9_g6_i1.p1 TRINITY_DN66393_c9_g6~~TRINITY_DN66393_c9_g6_i1.p1  ORF type:complete len:905 (+),score=80.97 TRINITY_DN66393_c9_g6_i1:32-2746(+)